MLEWYVKLQTWIVQHGSPVIKGFASVIESIANAFMGVVNWVDKAIGKIGSFTDKVSKVNLNPFSGSFNVPFLGKRASGGAVSAGQPFLVGERGPELFTPSSYGQITRNSQLGSGGITVNVYGDVSGQELIDKVKRGIMSELRLNARV